MRRPLLILAAAAASIAIAAPLAQATPQTDFTVVRVLPNGNEMTLATYLYVSGESVEQVIRTTAQDAGRQNRTNNPAWHIVIYCPTDNPDGYTVDDRCWDSTTDL